MTVWIDLANAPHVVFFLPIIRSLQKRGHEVAITMRDFNLTVELARKYGIDGVTIGKHGGKSDFGKFLNLLDRARQLARFAKNRNVDVAISHNSYTHTIAGRLIGARVVTLMDYEGQPANHIAFRLAHKILVPDSFPAASLKRFGASEAKVYRYRGFKEQLYLAEFVRADSFLGDLKSACALPESWRADDTVLVTLRTPATMATYHKFGNPLFECLLAKVASNPGMTGIVLARTDAQKSQYSKKFPTLFFPNDPLAGDQLVAHSDLVISAGGTMNREAAIFGTPAYTIFAGMLPAVDERLIQMGRMIAVRDFSDIAKIDFNKKDDRGMLRNPGLCDEIVTEILS